MLFPDFSYGIILVLRAFCNDGCAGTNPRYATCKGNCCSHAGVHSVRVAILLFLHDHFLPLQSTISKHFILVIDFSGYLIIMLIFDSGVRPFGVSLLVAGYDDKGPQLYQVYSLNK